MQIGSERRRKETLTRFALSDLNGLIGISGLAPISIFASAILSHL